MGNGSPVERRKIGMVEKRQINTQLTPNLSCSIHKQTHPPVKLSTITKTYFLCQMCVLTTSLFLFVVAGTNDFIFDTFFVFYFLSFLMLHLHTIRDLKKKYFFQFKLRYQSKSCFQLMLDNCKRLLRWERVYQNWLIIFCLSKSLAFVGNKEYGELD